MLFTKIENNIESRCIEIDIKLKDTKIFMYNSNEKVNIKI